MRQFVLNIIILVVSMWSLTALAQLDSIRARLLSAPVQEKVYLHLDNNCYFKGDTIWYKAYVMRADNLHYTDMSRIMYVELVSPEGHVLERQNHIVSHQGFGNGNFALTDSLFYSGYYEIRAYTRWMMNFCVTHRPYKSNVRDFFYNREMAKDFFRDFGTVYSRVVPVFEAPEGDQPVPDKFMVERPKQRQYADPEPSLEVKFFPEGGNIMADARNRIAFEVTDELGRWVDIEGTLTTRHSTLSTPHSPTANNHHPIRTSHQGRGVVEIDVPEGARLEASFEYQGKTYDFDLPKPARKGCALKLTQTEKEAVAGITLKGVPTDNDYAAVITCRGALCHFETLNIDKNGHAVVSVPLSELPTGVCDLVVSDEKGRPLADRLFFVNNHDYDDAHISVSPLPEKCDTFQLMAVEFQAPAGTPHISISVRDGATDEPSFDTNTMLTDLLLSSELKGFVADPAWFFADATDPKRAQDLDVLMMVQGWRRYDYAAMLSTKPLRYTPERNLSIEGDVYKFRSFTDLMPGDVAGMNVGNASNALSAKDAYLKIQAVQSDSYINESGNNTSEQTAAPEAPKPDEADADEAYFGVDNSRLRKEVWIETELVVGKDVVGIDTLTFDKGHFLVHIPPFYGYGNLFLSARDADMKDKKVNKLHNRGRLDEMADPEFYVKLNLFYPVFSKPYSFYECHSPLDELFTAHSPLPNIHSTLDNTHSTSFDSISSLDHSLEDVVVDGKLKRGKRRIDLSKPVVSYDSYYLYNLATDYGLSHGKLNPRHYPEELAILTFGNYRNHSRLFNVQALFDDYTFFRNFKPVGPEGFENVETMHNRSDYSLYRQYRLSRHWQTRFFTDFNFRKPEVPLDQSQSLDDVTVQFVLMPDDSKRRSFRDRYILYQGIYQPDEFYCPDYGNHPLPKDAHDYRRTLYWNPNAPLDADGRFTARFYTNGKPTHLKVSAAGLTLDGKPLSAEE